MHFKRLFCIYEQNFWITPVKEFFFSVYYTPGYICVCSQCSTVKMFDIIFSKSPSRNKKIKKVSIRVNNTLVLINTCKLFRKKAIWKYFLWLIYMRSLTYVDIKYMCFCKWNWGTDFHKTNFENSKKLESIVNIFVFFIKISCQNKKSSLSKPSPFKPTPPFLEKMFHPHSYCQVRGTQSPPL